MPQSLSVATDEWTRRKSAAIMDPFNQSGTSTEPSEYPSWNWDIRREEQRIQPLPPEDDQAQDDQAQQEHKLTLTDQQFAVRISETAKLFAEHAAKKENARSFTQQIEHRISFLKAEARLEGEPFNPASEQYFWQFMNNLPFFRKPRIFLVDEGDIRAVWKGEGGVHIGLQFLGIDNVQYVIFAKRSEARDVSRVYGRDTFRGILRQITAFDIEDLISA